VIRSSVELDRHSRLLEEAEELLPGACVGVWRMPDGTTFIASRGLGSHIWDVAGNDYIDTVMGNGPNILGHAAPSVVQAVQRQAALGSQLVAVSEPALELARMLVDASPCAEKVRFTHSGTEATHSALRMARAFTGREKVLKFEGGFHGHHDYALQSFAPTRKSDYPHGIPDSLGIPAAVGETVLVAPFNDAAMTTDLIAKNHEDLAAVMVEPLQRVIEPAPGFLEALRDATSQYGVVLIFDEIVTGFRLGWGGAQERYGVIPDVATYGKAMTGGYTISAIAGKREILDTSDPRRAASGGWSYFGGTFNGNPISTAASVAALRELRKPGTYDRLRSTGGRLRRGLVEVAEKHSIQLQTPGDDAFFQPVFVDGEIRDYGDMLRADLELGRRFGVAMLKRGVFNVPNAKWYMSTALSEEDVDTVLGLADEVFASF
jgi:glutamate-1-semialdehyde 2,1-aminomutase